MPETTVDKHGHLRTREHDVGSAPKTDKRCPIDPVPEPSSVQPAPEGKLRRGVPHPLHLHAGARRSRACVRRGECLVTSGASRVTGSSIAGATFFRGGHLDGLSHLQTRIAGVDGRKAMQTAAHGLARSVCSSPQAAEGWNIAGRTEDRRQRLVAGARAWPGGVLSLGLNLGLIRRGSPSFFRSRAPASRALQPLHGPRRTTGRGLGKRVGGNPSRVRISYPPLPTSKGRRRLRCRPFRVAPAHLPATVNRLLLPKTRSTVSTATTPCLRSPQVLPRSVGGRWWCGCSWRTYELW